MGDSSREVRQTPNLGGEGYYDADAQHSTERYPGDLLGQEAGLCNGRYQSKSDPLF